jgi:hypothetical protein
MFLGVMELRRSNPIEWQLTGSHFDLLIFRCGRELSASRLQTGHSKFGAFLHYL